MQFLELTLASAAENLALDEALLLQAEADQGGEVLRLWEWPFPAVVLGSGGKRAEDVHLAVCQRDGVPVLRRSSGGGTVLLGNGCLCFSLILAYSRHEALTEIRPSYTYILKKILDQFALPELQVQGISDLTLQGYKFSGNAQQRKRRYLLHHGTILYNFDLIQVSRYLRDPVRQPDYRDRREHQAFLRNLGQDRTWLRDRLRAAWQANQHQSAWPGQLVTQLVAEKYALPSWIERR